MRNLDIDLLRTFVAVCDAGGFTAASRQIHLTQSAVSMQMKRLEQSLDGPLLVRKSRGLDLTDAGESLLVHARRILQMNDEAVAELTHPAVMGIVRLGIPDGFGTGFLTRMIQEFLRTYPQVQMEVHCQSTPALLVMLDQGELDLAITVRDVDKPAGDFLWSETMVWATSEYHQVHLQDPVPLVLYPRASVCRECGIEALSTVGKKWRVAFCSGSLAAVHMAVQAGIGVAILSDTTMAPGIRRLTHREGFPGLFTANLELRRAPVQSSEAVEHLADQILATAQVLTGVSSVRAA